MHRSLLDCAHHDRQADVPRRLYLVPVLGSSALHHDGAMKTPVEQRFRDEDRRNEVWRVISLELFVFLQVRRPGGRPLMALLREIATTPTP
jgi:hypothetical protein